MMAIGAIAQEMMKPPAELAKLAFLLGSWKGNGTMDQGDGSTGKITDQAVGAKKLGDMWVEFKTNATMGAMGKMEGQLMLTYDTAKKKYVGSWFDSMSPQAMTMAGDFQGNKLVLDCDPIDMGGPEKMVFRITYDMVSAKEVVFLLDMKAGDQYVNALKITYTK